MIRVWHFTLSRSNFDFGWQEPSGLLLPSSETRREGVIIMHQGAYFGKPLRLLCRVALQAQKLPEIGFFFPRQNPGPPHCCLTVHLNPVNTFIVPIQYPMPVLEHELTKKSTSKYFPNFDFTHTYWKVRLYEASQEFQSTIIGDIIYSISCILHGTAPKTLFYISTRFVRLIFLPLFVIECYCGLITVFS